MLHKVRFVSKGTETHVFLDDKEIHGCISANFDYRVDALPLVNLELTALGIETEAEQADVYKTLDEPIEVLGLSTKTIEILHDGYWWNKNGEQQSDPVLTVGYLLKVYKDGQLGKYKGIGPYRISNIVRVLKERGLI